MDSVSHRKNLEEILKTREDGKLLRREGKSLEFKESFNFNGMAEYLRDFASFANNKGGYLVFGVKDHPRIAVGLKPTSKDQFDKIDPEMITGFLLETFTGHIDWEHDVVEVNGKYYGYFYVEEAKEKPIICKKDEGGKEKILKESAIYYRYNGRTQIIRYSELEAIINNRIKEQNQQWVAQLNRLGKAGAANAAILDMDKRTLQTDAQVLVVDEKLVERIKFVKEGQFVEKDGAPTLKLVGDVTPVNKVEVIKHEKVNPLTEYPLSAAELAAQVKSKGGIKMNDIWRIISEHKIKENKDLAYYNFRNKKQAETYIQNGKVASGVPSIYKPAAVDYIIQLAQQGQ